MELELLKTIDDIRMLHKRIVAIGPVDHDQLLTVFLLNSLGEKLQPLHSQLLNAIDDPSFSSETIIRRFGYKESYHRHRLTQNPSLSTALVAQGRNKSRPSCTHCKKLGHFTEFCIQSGGKMAGQSIEEARAALNKQPKDNSTTVTSTANVAASTSTTGSSGTTDSSTVSTATSGANTVSATTSCKALIVDSIMYYPSVPLTACVAMSNSAWISPVPSKLHASPVSSLSSFCSYLM